MSTGGLTRALAVRALLYFALWIVVDQSAKPANLVFGLLASAAATWASVKLLPPASDRIRLGQLLLLLPHFLWQSLVAGADVAHRAFAPQPRLQPGFVDYPVGLPRGAGRNAFELIASLMPGTVASDGRPDMIEFHCLDTGQAVVEQLAAEERAYARALQPEPRDG